jgi:hypothetical protein
MTPLDTLLIDQYTGGMNVPLASQAGYVVRANAEGNNVEYVGPQSLAGTGSWDGVAPVIFVSGSGARTITLKNGFAFTQEVLIVDIVGTAGAGNITVATSEGSISGNVSMTTNHDSRRYMYVSAGKWVRVPG